MIRRACLLAALCASTTYCQPTVIGGDGSDSDESNPPREDRVYVEEFGPCDTLGERAWCSGEFGEGPTVCEESLDADGLAWGECDWVSECTRECEGDSECEQGCGDTPLVLSFDNAPIQFTTAPGDFMLNPTMCVGTDWVSAATPWLALDRNGDGNINDGSELFGSATVLSTGLTAKHGFMALAELDTNGDRVISGGELNGLVLWADTNADRVSSAVELSSLTSRGVTEISLTYSKERRCDARGNCEGERATFRFLDGTTERAGEVVDLYLANH
jgi:hypothetical protein